MIDRLPFTPPDDPVLTARIERINAQGGNAFMDHQLPQAVILLKQGAGRLIRDETDRGVLMICDPRIITKSYGKRVWQSLPPMRRTRDIRDVEAFFEAEGVQVAAPLSQPSERFFFAFPPLCAQRVGEGKGGGLGSRGRLMISLTRDRGFSVGAFARTP
jgi:hypothetical protein